MNKKIAYLTATLVCCALGLSSCDDDDDSQQWPRVDGASPQIELAAEHISTEAGAKFHIKGLVSDADGIVAINLRSEGLNLDKTIDLVQLYGEPQKEYELDYHFTTSEDEIGERFPITITVEDAVGNREVREMLITLDADYVAPAFGVCPSGNITILLSDDLRLGLKFSVSDNRRLDSVRVEIPELQYVNILREFSDGGRALDFDQKIALPAGTATYHLTITAVDLKGNQAVAQATYKVQELPDFDNIWLADVESADELNADCFGVPIAAEHIGPYRYEARYYCTKANTPVRLLPQKTDFTPICFGLDPDDPSKLSPDPERCQPIVLPLTGVYYKIVVDLKAATYDISSYTPQEALDPMPLVYGSNTFEVWGPGSEWIIPFEVGVLATIPPDVVKFKQDAVNPHLFTVDLDITPDQNGHFSFKTHNYHPAQWWQYCQWTVDKEENKPDPDRWVYSGLNVNSNWLAITGDAFCGASHYDKSNDNWAYPAVPRKGMYTLTFDAHLGRARLTAKK